MKLQANRRNMALRKIAEYNPNYRNDLLNGQEIKGFDVYSGTTTEEKIGTVHDVLVDETGRFRYVVIDTGFWIFGKKVLLPVGRARVNYDKGNLYALGLDKRHAEALPKYDENTVVDYDYEETVRTAYRSPEEVKATSSVETYDRDTYSYDREPELYGTDNRGVIKLYEERLVADKDRYKAGEVAVGKRVETETASTSVPVENERVVIERNQPHETRAVQPGEANFREGEVARMEVHEEQAHIGKEAVVSEEVSVRKEVDRDTVSGEETLRREKLDVDVEGNPKVGGDRDIARR